MRVYGVAIRKGGQGKSTTVSTVARLAATYGARVLVVDLAQPGTTSASLRDIWPEVEYGELSALLHAFRAVSPGAVPPAERVVEAMLATQLPIQFRSQPSWSGGCIAFLPWDELLADAAGFLHSERVLAGILAALEGSFDLALIDFPGEGGPLLTNAVAATDRVIMPLAPETPALEGADALLRLMARARDAGHDITLAGILLTRCEPKSNKKQRMTDVVAAITHAPEVEGEALSNKLLPFAIRVNDYFEQAFRYGVPVWERTGDPSDWAGYVLMAEWLLRDAGLDALTQTRRGPALLPPDTRILDTTAFMLPNPEVKLQDFELAHGLAASRERR